MTSISSSGRSSADGGDVLYSIRDCPGCGAAMSATSNRWGRRIWRCGDCGRTQR